MGIAPGLLPHTLDHPSTTQSDRERCGDHQGVAHANGSCVLAYLTGLAEAVRSLRSRENSKCSPDPPHPQARGPGRRPTSFWLVSLANRLPSFPGAKPDIVGAAVGWVLPPPCAIIASGTGPRAYDLTSHREGHPILIPYPAAHAMLICGPPTEGGQGHYV